jgi:hypothetical protein
MSHGDFLSLEGSMIVWVPATFFAWILATSVVLLRAGIEVDWARQNAAPAGNSPPSQSGVA